MNGIGNACERLYFSAPCTEEGPFACHQSLFGSGVNLAWVKFGRDIPLDNTYCNWDNMPWDDGDGEVAWASPVWIDGEEKT